MNIFVLYLGPGFGNAIAEVRDFWDDNIQVLKLSRGHQGVQYIALLQKELLLAKHTPYAGYYSSDAVQDLQKLPSNIR